MALHPDEASRILLDGLNEEQRHSVASDARRLLVIAGAGSGKTEIMARRVAWWVAIGGVPKDQIIAFTFTEAAAEELKFRIRSWLQRIAGGEEDATLGGMFIGTIHGFCLHALRELAPSEYYMYDVLDDAGRASLIQQGANNVLGLMTFQTRAREADRASGLYGAYDLFISGYDQINEHGLLRVNLPAGAPPADVRRERDWCLEATLETAVGEDELSEAFADSAARYYAYLRARRFLDFGTVQSELIEKLRSDQAFRERFSARWNRLVVDEVQDINPVQDSIIRQIVGDAGHLTAVGDHRQAIYAFRGGRIDLMGAIYQEIADSDDGTVVELPANYRSTPRIIRIANEWSSSIGDTADMSNPSMRHGREARDDLDSRHVSLVRFSEREGEADWIARSISDLVMPDVAQGATHDARDADRGLTYADVAILVRSGTDIRVYQEALRAANVPAVVRGGPDLFSQPETLLVVSAFALAAGVDELMGERDQSMAGRVRATLDVEAQPRIIVPAAAAALRDRGLNVSEAAVDRAVALAALIRDRSALDRGFRTGLDDVRCAEAKAWLRRGGRIRRVFPQQIFYWLLEELGLAEWGTGPQAEVARFHVGQISRLIKGIETSGWTPPQDLRWQVIALLTWVAPKARAEEAPLLVAPNAVTITTVHAAKGLEFPAVFLADVCARRFPSNQAKRRQNMPFDLEVVTAIDPRRLADNDNNDGERRLMYVALTRAERYLFVTYSSTQKSSFIRELEPIFERAGATVTADEHDLGPSLSHTESSFDTDDRFATSFSDLRYFIECPQDFYMRVILGFTPTIGQEFGYGRGVHSLLRAVHGDAAAWANLADNADALQNAIDQLVDDGLFYLRYTTGEPLNNLRAKAVEGVREYIRRYAAELSELEFEPEKEFETLIPDERLLISGAIDLLRLDNPPRVTVIDFKSGNSAEETGSGLTSDLMALQIGVYGLAARNELEYEPQSGKIRYIGERDDALAEATVDLTDDQLAAVRSELIQAARRIRSRSFNEGPSARVPDRCSRCDFKSICPRPEAEAERAS